MADAKSMSPNVPLQSMRQWQRAWRVGSKGMALAVVEDGKVVLTRADGLRTNAGAPPETTSIVSGASLTKAVIAYTVMLPGNDVNDERLFPELVKTVLDEASASWRWEYPEPFVRP